MKTASESSSIEMNISSFFLGYDCSSVDLQIEAHTHTHTHTQTLIYIDNFSPVFLILAILDTIHKYVWTLRNQAAQ